MASASVRVASTRLLRSTAFRAAVHRPPAIDSPARLTMAEAPSITEVVRPAVPSGRQPTRVIPGTPVPESCWLWPSGSARVSTRTSWPSSAHASQSGLPRNPEPPATTIFIGVLDDSPAREVCREGCTIMAPQLPRGSFPFHTAMRYLCRAAVFALLPCVAAAQERVVPVPPTRAPEGLPAIPQSISYDLDKYTDFDDAHLDPLTELIRGRVVPVAAGN